ncbi:beta-glucosidase [Verrucomicrobium sp. GAS474]|uniref:fibronectin type III-like domain-contianing protein n=1 Tax=Verrucomicrobium sp. GAS474 TaxID=1882831 RepID=UPI00087DC497|nr:fibronectin type III-like domain-contianing protein [Verrucomicrobium sp. GAS474]SDU11960.1 beta-glucosidase [Verrucomicrobium sp. GAS474]
MEEPVRELKGFQRVTLSPGQSKQVDFTLGFDELSHYNLQMEQAVEPCSCLVWIGGSSEAEQGANFQITP